MDRSTQKKEHFKLGDKVTVQGAAPRKDYTLVGFTQVAGVDSFGGAVVIGLIPPEALRMLGKTGYDTIQVAAKPGVTPEALAQSLRAELPLTVNVRTGEQESQQAVGGHRERPRLPAHVPARLRLRVAVRRRVHHLQLVLDHRRAAHR